MSSGRERLSLVRPPTGEGDLTRVTQQQVRQQGLGKDPEPSPHRGAPPPPPKKRSHRIHFPATSTVQDPDNVLKNLKRMGPKSFVFNFLHNYSLATDCLTCSTASDHFISNLFSERVPGSDEEWGGGGFHFHGVHPVPWLVPSPLLFPPPLPSPQTPRLGKRVTKKAEGKKGSPLYVHVFWLAGNDLWSNALTGKVRLPLKSGGCLADLEPVSLLVRACSSMTSPLPVPAPSAQHEHPA